MPHDPKPQDGPRPREPRDRPVEQEADKDIKEGGMSGNKRGRERPADGKAP
jgi:hypothetical protein